MQKRTANHALKPERDHERGRFASLARYRSAVQAHGGKADDFLVRLDDFSQLERHVLVLRVPATHEKHNRKEARQDAAQGRYCT